MSVIVLAGTLIFRGDASTLLNNITSQGGDYNLPFLRYVVISQDISLFIIPGIIILNLMEKSGRLKLTNIQIPATNEIIMVIILAFCIFPITSFTGQINSGIHLPQWLSGVEQWMVEKEDKADNMIDLLVVSKTFWVMLLNLLTIAIIPAIGEEMIFRGVIQKILTDLFKSGHLAIWITSFFFSAIHFQFFGFVPRFILGLVFGYLFLWSGTLWLPIIAHSVNNAFPVILAYIQGVDILNTHADAPLWKQAIYLPLPVAIGVVILLYFRNKNISREIF